MKKGNIFLVDLNKGQNDSRKKFLGIVLGFIGSKVKIVPLEKMKNIKKHTDIDYRFEKDDKFKNKRISIEKIQYVKIYELKERRGEIPDDLLDAILNKIKEYLDN